MRYIQAFHCSCMPSWWRSKNIKWHGILRLRVGGNESELTSTLPPYTILNLRKPRLSRLYLWKWDDFNSRVKNNPMFFSEGYLTKISCGEVKRTICKLATFRWGLFTTRLEPCYRLAPFHWVSMLQMSRNLTYPKSHCKNFGFFNGLAWRSHLK